MSTYPRGAPVAFEPRVINKRRYPFRLGPKYHDRPYRKVTLKDAEPCSWDGAHSRTMYVPATEAGEMFCSMKCFTSDTLTCYEPRRVKKNGD